MPAILRTGRVCESRADVACILHEHPSYPARARRRSAPARAIKAAPAPLRQARDEANISRLLDALSAQHYRSQWHPMKTEAAALLKDLRLGPSKASRSSSKPIVIHVSSDGVPDLEHAHGTHGGASGAMYAAAVRALSGELAGGRVPVLVLATNYSAHRAAVRRGLAALRVRTQLTVQSNDDPLDDVRALLAAPRVVWASATRMKLVTLLRTEPYEGVWSYCSGRTEVAHILCGELLPPSRARHEVHVREFGGSQQQRHSRKPGATESGNGGGRQHAPPSPPPSKASAVVPLEVRSTTTARWLTHTTPAVDLSPVNASNDEWHLEDACVAYGRGLGIQASRGQERESVLAQAHATTRSILWPLDWPSVTTEYGRMSPRYGHRPANAWRALYGASGNVSDRCTWHEGAEDGAAFVTAMTMDNLFHALLAAVPTFDFYTRVRTHLGRMPQLVPHFHLYWPPNAAGMTGWRMLAHALGVNQAEWPAIAARAEQYTRPGECHCFRHVFGGHAETPIVRGVMHKGRARFAARLGAFQKAVAAGLPMEADTLPERILFVLRHCKARTISNEAVITASIAANESLAAHVHFVVFDGLPLVEQFAQVRRSMAIAGVHGQALAWAMMLPESGGRSAALEITGEWPSFHKTDYVYMSEINGVRYFRLSQPNTPACVCTKELRAQGGCAGLNFRDCGNITAVPEEVASALLRVLQHMRGAAHGKEKFTEKRALRLQEKRTLRGAGHGARNGSLRGLRHVTQNASWGPGHVAQNASARVGKQHPQPHRAWGAATQPSERTVVGIG